MSHAWMCMGMCVWERGGCWIQVSHMRKKPQIFWGGCGCVYGEWSRTVVGRPAHSGWHSTQGREYWILWMGGRLSVRRTHISSLYSQLCKVTSLCQVPAVLKSPARRIITWDCGPEQTSPLNCSALSQHQKKQVRQLSSLSWNNTLLFLITHIVTSHFFFNVLMTVWQIFWEIHNSTN